MNNFKIIVYAFLVVVFFSCGSSKAQGYRTHKIQVGETIEAIAKKYDVQVSDIYRLNPDAKLGVRPNVTLLIPKPASASSSQATINKKVSGFKRHKVRRKETLYSLSKKYGVFIEDIKKHNEFLYSNPLKKGNILRIPIFERVKEVARSKTKKYIVKPTEGKWRIAYTHGISVPELEALNPGLAQQVLQVGQIINVPNITEDALQPVNENQFNYYTVLPKEGFYRLKVKLGVEQEQLEALNPGLKESGLKEGMVLKVPLSTRFVDGMSTSSSTIPTTTVDTTQVAETIGFLEPEKVDLKRQIFSTETKKIAVMLPFKSNSVDVSNEKEAKKKIGKDPFMSRSLDFYSGVLMATKTLKKLGVNLQVDVYDTENKTATVDNILSDLDIQSLDAVIGPLMPKPFDKVAQRLQAYNTPVVSPVTKKVTMRQNVFQSRTSQEELEDKIVGHFSKDTTNQHVIIISDSKNEETSKRLKVRFPNAQVLLSQKDPKSQRDKYYVVNDSVVDVLLQGRNVVFLETQNAGFVSNVSSILNSLITDDVKITLATTSMNKAFESEEVSNYHLSNLNFIFPTIAKMYNEDNSSLFTRLYKREYGVTPNTFAVRGYDLMMDVALRVATADNLYASVTTAPLTVYTENKFAYNTTGNGYVNRAAYLVKYDNLKIVEIKD